MSERRKLYIKSYYDQKEILLPVTPLFDWNESMSATSQDLLGAGEIDTGMTRNLCTFTLTSFFPAQGTNYDFALTNNTPAYYKNWLYRWMDNYKLLFTYCTDEKVLRKIEGYITKFAVGEKDGSRNEHYTIEVKEHKDLKCYSAQMSIDAQEVIRQYGTDAYYVGEGDTLMSIAAKLFGDSSKWDYLMNNNNLKNPLDLKVGQKLLI